MRISRINLMVKCQFGIAVVLALLLLNSGCQTQKEYNKQVPNRDINTVMNDHVSDLMKIPGVVGVAVGELEDKRPCIQVLVVERTDEIDRKVPKTLEGHPVSIIVSGIIKPMQGN